MNPLLAAAAVALLALTACHTQRQSVGVTATPQARPAVVPDTVTAQGSPRVGRDISPSTLIIMCDGTEGKEAVKQAVKEYGATVIYDYQMMNGLAIKIPEGADIHQARKHFQTVKGVLSVEYDHIYHVLE